MRNPLTAKSISFEQIRTLGAEALDHEDFDLFAICNLALDGTIDVDDYTTLSRAGANKIREMSREQAYAECAKAINVAAAMKGT